MLDPKELLPHREPFIFIDEVIELKPNEYSKTKRKVKEDEFWVKGHFPDKPIFPGALILEVMAQTGGLIFRIDKGVGHNSDSHGIYMTKVNNLKLLRMIEPGETLIAEGFFMDSIMSFRKAKTKLYSDNRLVAEAEITYVMQKKDFLQSMSKDRR